MTFIKPIRLAWPSLLLLAGVLPVAPKFEVATIKPSPDGPMKMVGIRYLPDGIHAENATLQMLTRFAQGYTNFPTDDRVTGAPEWAKTEKFNIDAKVSSADAEALQKLSHEEQLARINPMIQTLLEERFKLKTHRETKQVAIYELVTAKGGPRLKESAADTRNSMSFGREKLTAHGFTMAALAGFLSQPAGKVGRPVVDKTGLIGKYDFEVNWNYPGVTMNGVPPPDDGPSIFTALQDDLGLKLQPATGTVATIAVDSVERPSGN